MLIYLCIKFYGNLQNKFEFSIKKIDVRVHLFMSHCLCEFKHLNEKLAEKWNKLSLGFSSKRMISLRKVIRQDLC